MDVGLPDLANRLNHLFETVPRPDKREYWTNEGAAAELGRKGTTVSHAYLSQLRNGKRDNPSARHLAAIAELFEVPMEYFFNTQIAEKIDADLRFLVALRDSGVQGVALRAQGLSAANLASLADIIDQVRKLEQLPTEGELGHASKGESPPP